MLVFCTQNTPVHKSVFIIFFRGDTMKKKICMICEGFKATLYDCPDSMPERVEMLSTIKTDLQDIQVVCITIFTFVISPSHNIPPLLLLLLDVLP
jgi:vacuolar-type H+-ATPase subunit I/STV1